MASSGACPKALAWRIFICKREPNQMTSNPFHRRILTMFVRVFVCRAMPINPPRPLLPSDFPRYAIQVAALLAENLMMMLITMNFLQMHIESILEELKR